MFGVSPDLWSSIRVWVMIGSHSILKRTKTSIDCGPLWKHDRLPKRKCSINPSDCHSWSIYYISNSRRVRSIDLVIHHDPCVYQILIDPSSHIFMATSGWHELLLATKTSSSWFLAHFPWNPPPLANSISSPLWVVPTGRCEDLRSNVHRTFQWNAEVSPCPALVSIPQLPTHPSGLRKQGLLKGFLTIIVWLCWQPCEMNLLKCWPWSLVDLVVARHISYHQKGLTTKNGTAPKKNNTKKVWNTCRSWSHSIILNAAHYTCGTNMYLYNWLTHKPLV